MSVSVPLLPRVATGGMVCAADQLAASAGAALLEDGGSAADAAVGAAAVMAVVAPHLCGIGGDLLAVLQRPGDRPLALVSIGSAGSGADPDRLRSDGHSDMPFRKDIRSVTVPGAVDGWLALHARFGNLPVATVLERAITLATDGFSASPLLVLASALLDDAGANELCPTGARLDVDQVVRLPALGRTLQAVVDRGRDGFYGGQFGRDLLAIGNGEFERSDLDAEACEWVEPLHLTAFGHEWWTVPPPSQGYLTLLSASIAEQRGLPVDPDDPRFAEVIVTSSEVAGLDRPDVLFDGADGTALLGAGRIARLLEQATSSTSPTPRRRPSRTSRIRARRALEGDGDTTHLCVVDRTGFGISLTVSNALDFGSHLVTPTSGVFLHNRGIGFSLRPGHPAEYWPRRRPPHTLSPALVTELDGSLSHLAGAMGGDSQPQVILQALVRLLHARQDPATAVGAARIVLDAEAAPPFRLWDAEERGVLVESDAPDGWREAMIAARRAVTVVSRLSPVAVGCVQVIAVHHGRDGIIMTGAADPRSPVGIALGV